jgi:hypothetical protein
MLEYALSDGHEPYRKDNRKWRTCQMDGCIENPKHRQLEPLIHNSLTSDNVWALWALTFKNPLLVWSHAGQPHAINLTRVPGQWIFPWTAENYTRGGSGRRAFSKGRALPPLRRDGALLVIAQALPFENARWPKPPPIHSTPPSKKIQSPNILTTLECSP